MVPKTEDTLLIARRHNWAACILLFALTTFRLWYGSTHELVQDEAYYWQWSRHLDWGYYDNTPLLAAVIRFFTTILGPTQLGVRAGAALCSLTVSIFVYLIARKLLGYKVAMAALVLTNIVPEFTGGSVLMTQDPVQLAMWSAALYVILLALEGKNYYWILAGILAGLASESKLNALLLMPSILLYILLSATARQRWLVSPWPYIAAVIAIAIFAPFIWWNHTHQNAFWIHIHAMGTRSSAHDGLKWFGRFLGDQAGLMSPFIFLTYLYALFAIGKKAIKEQNAGLLYLWCPSIVVFAATALVSFHSKVEGNWPVAAYITGLILVAYLLINAWENGARFQRIWPMLCVVVAALLSMVSLYPSLVYSVGLKYKHPSKDRFMELYGWKTLGNRVQQERFAMGTDPFIFGINYRMPSEAAFYLPDQPQTYSLFLNDRANEYMFWEDPTKLVGRDAICIHDTDGPDHLDDLRQVFRRVEVQKPLLVYKNPPYPNKPIRTIQVYRCYHFNGYDVKKWQDGW
jgi:hypothetical protein